MLAIYVDRWVPKHVEAMAGTAVASVDLGRPSASAQVSRSAGPRTGTPARARGRGSVTGTLLGDEDLEPPLAPGRKRVGFATAIIAITLPVGLMLIDAITKLVITDEENGFRKVVDFLGTPVVALLIAVLFCYVALGFGSG